MGTRPDSVHVPTLIIKFYADILGTERHVDVSLLQWGWGATGTRVYCLCIRPQSTNQIPLSLILYHTKYK